MWKGTAFLYAKTEVCLKTRERKKGVEEELFKSRKNSKSRGRRKSQEGMCSSDAVCSSSIPSTDACRGRHIHMYTHITTPVDVMIDFRVPKCSVHRYYKFVQVCTSM